MSRYFESAPPRILAHRGLAHGETAGGRTATENTLEAFSAALDAGATHLETDAHASSDGVAVLWHDPTLERFDGGEVALERATWPALRRLGTEGRRLCSLAEALDAFPDARFNIDVKSTAAVEPVADAIRASGAADRVLLTSFRESRANAVWRLVPDAARSATSERTAAALLAIELGSEALLARALRGIDALQVPERRAGLTLTHPKRLRAVRRHVREVHVWTVNDPADMRRLWLEGIDGVVTDRADLAAAALAELTAAGVADA